MFSCGRSCRRWHLGPGVDWGRIVSALLAGAQGGCLPLMEPPYPDASTMGRARGGSNSCGAIDTRLHRRQRLFMKRLHGRSGPGPPPGPASRRPMAAITEGVAVGAAAAAHQHRGRFVQTQLMGKPAMAQVGAIAEPAVAAAATAAELVHTGRQDQRLRAGGGSSAGAGRRALDCGLSHPDQPSRRVLRPVWVAAKRTAAPT